MNTLVMVTENEDGVIDDRDCTWCIAADFDTARTLCGEPLDEASHYKTVEKTVKRGGITCQKCLGIVRSIKAIKL